jgi:hypothetical protein
VRKSPLNSRCDFWHGVQRLLLRPEPFLRDTNTQNIIEANNHLKWAPSSSSSDASSNSPKIQNPQQRPKSRREEPQAPSRITKNSAKIIKYAYWTDADSIFITARLGRVPIGDRGRCLSCRITLRGRRQLRRRSCWIWGFSLVGGGELLFMFCERK